MIFLLLLACQVKIEDSPNPDVTDKMLREAIHIVLKDKIWRFTAKVMLGAVAGSAFFSIGVGIFAILPGANLAPIAEALPEYLPGVLGTLMALFRAKPI